MKITHKMTIPDRLREILRVTGWKQKELAGKLNVSPKTMSFWVNAKKRPSEQSEARIAALFDEIMNSKGEFSAGQSVVQDYQAREGFDEDDKNFTIAEKTYYEGKCFVLAKEKENRRFVYLYPSVGKNNGEWYKAGGNSMVFYKTFLAPRLGREAKLRDDNDGAHRFNSGIVSVRWGRRLIEEARALGYGAEIIDHGVIVVDLMKDYAKAEIVSLAKAVKAEKHKVKKMVKPVNNHPKLMVAMNELIKVLPSKVKKIDASYREIWGKQLLEPMAELVKIYFRFANGRMEKRDARLEMLERTDDLTAMVYMMDEAGMLNVTARTRLGEDVLNIRKEIEANLK